MHCSRTLSAKRDNTRALITAAIVVITWLQVGAAWAQQTPAPGPLPLPSGVSTSTRPPSIDSQEQARVQAEADRDAASAAQVKANEMTQMANARATESHRRAWAARGQAVADARSDYDLDSENFNGASARVAASIASAGGGYLLSVSTAAQLHWTVANQFALEGRLGVSSTHYTPAESDDANLAYTSFFAKTGVRFTTISKGSWVSVVLLGGIEGPVAGDSQLPGSVLLGSAELGGGMCWVPIGSHGCGGLAWGTEVGFRIPTGATPNPQLAKVGLVASFFFGPEVNF